MEISAGTDERLRRLADAAKESAAAAADDRETRDTAIWEAEQAGYSTNKLHRVTGLSLGHVQRILVAQTAKRQAVHVS